MRSIRAPWRGRACRESNAGVPDPEGTITRTMTPRVGVENLLVGRIRRDHLGRYLHVGNGPAQTRMGAVIRRLCRTIPAPQVSRPKVRWVLEPWKGLISRMGGTWRGPRRKSVGAYLLTITRLNTYTLSGRLTLGVLWKGRRHTGICKT